MDETIKIIVACVSTAAFWTFLQFLINRHDSKKNNNDDIKKELGEIKLALAESKQDTTRIQLQNLINHDPTNKDAIFEVGKKYFTELGGNWYMDSIFQKWAHDYGIALPSWFKGK